MARVRIVLDKIGIRADANKFARATVFTTSRKVFNRSQILCPVHNGYLRSTGKAPKILDSARGPRGIVEYTARYAAAVEDGSRPHVIKARKKKALRFKYQGRTVIVKSVKHPGAPGRSFLRRAAQEVALSEGYRFIRRN